MTTVLIIDDVATDRHILGRVVSDAGYHAIYASGGKEGLELARKLAPSLIFLDVVMPDMNGFHVCRDLKRDPATRKIPVVMVTSKTEESDRFWSRKQGADEHVAKPFTAEAILDCLRRLAV